MNEQRRIVRPQGQGNGSQRLCLPGQTTWLATFQAGDPDGEAMTVEGRALPGTATSGNQLVADAVLVHLEVSLANISYIEEFPWSAPGWRRRIVAQQVKVSARNLIPSGPTPEVAFTLSASIQRGWVHEHDLTAYFKQATRGFASAAAYLRVPQATVRFEAMSKFGTSLVSFGHDTKPNNVGSGVAGDAAAPSAVPSVFFPITQFYGGQPWPAWASVLWLKEPAAPAASDQPWFTFRA